MTPDPDALRSQLQVHGERLRAAERTRTEEHAAIADLLPAALDAGLSKREIARLTGVGRPWIDKTLARRV